MRGEAPKSAQPGTRRRARALATQRQLPQRCSRSFLFEIRVGPKLTAIRGAPKVGEKDASMNAGHLLQEYIEQVAPACVPGVSIAVARADQVVWEGSAGWVDIEQETRLHNGVAFGIGSITKVFVAVLVMQLAEEGLLSLDDRLGNWLAQEEFENVANFSTATVRQLLSHHSGIPSWEDDSDWIRHARGALSVPHKQWTTSEPLNFIRHKKALCEAGREFNYSNTNFTLLGLLIEQVTGQRLGAQLEQRILSPLGLSSTYLESFATAKDVAVSNRYHWANDLFKNTAGISEHFHAAGQALVNVSNTNLSVEWAAGGIVSTSRDLAHFFLALRNRALLNSQSMSQMQAWAPTRDDGEVGLSLFRINTSVGPAIGHGGNVLGFSASAWWFEGIDCVVAVLTNVGSMHAGPNVWNASNVFKQTVIGELARRICAD